MNQRPRFFSCQALFDNFTFTPAALFKRQGDGRLYRVDNAERCNHVAARFTRLLAAGGENRRIGFR